MDTEKVNKLLEQYFVEAINDTYYSVTFIGNDDTDIAGGQAITALKDLNTLLLANNKVNKTTAEAQTLSQTSKSKQALKLLYSVQSDFIKKSKSSI